MPILDYHILIKENRKNHLKVRLAIRQVLFTGTVSSSLVQKAER